jgi:A/G-specific adenine glycosylase
MAALPGTEWNEVPPGRLRAIGTVRHVFTHFSLDLHIVARDEPTGEGWWQPLDQLDEAGLPTLYRKAVEIGLSGRDRLAA